MDKKEDEDFFQWEYARTGQSVSVWAVVVGSLLRSADLLWARAAASAQLWAEAFTTDERGLPVATSRRLIGEEIELFQDSEIDRTALLLLGFAIENLGKSILIGRSPSLVSEDGTYRGPAHHDLVTLVTECGVESTPEQRDCLVALTDYAEWLGRYAIPTSYKKGRSTRGAWVWHRMKPRNDIWTECRPLATQLLSLRDQ